MKQFIAAIAVLISFSSVSQNLSSEQEAVKQVIEASYVQAIHNNGEIAAIDEGFHPGFEMLIKNRNDGLSKYPIYSWKESAKKRKAKNPEGPKEETTAKYPMIDVTGDAAVVKVELYKKDKKIFTDYISLYKFKDGWKVVGKIYHKHS